MNKPSQLLLRLQALRELLLAARLWRLVRRLLLLPATGKWLSLAERRGVVGRPGPKLGACTSCPIVARRRRAGESEERPASGRGVERWCAFASTCDSMHLTSQMRVSSSVRDGVPLAACSAEAVSALSPALKVSTNPHGLSRDLRCILASRTFTAGELATACALSPSLVAHGVGLRSRAGGGELAMSREDLAHGAWPPSKARGERRPSFPIPRASACPRSGDCFEKPSASAPPQRFLRSVLKDLTELERTGAGIAALRDIVWGTSIDASSLLKVLTAEPSFCKAHGGRSGVAVPSRLHEPWRTRGRRMGREASAEEADSAEDAWCFTPNSNAPSEKFCRASV